MQEIDRLCETLVQRDVPIPEAVCSFGATGAGEPLEVVPRRFFASAPFIPLLERLMPTRCQILGVGNGHGRNVDSLIVGTIVGSGPNTNSRADDRQDRHDDQYGPVSRKSCL